MSVVFLGYLLGWWMIGAFVFLATCWLLDELGEWHRIVEAFLWPLALVVGAARKIRGDRPTRRARRRDR